MRVIAVYNIKGGVGKTAGAVNFAWLSAKQGARTLLWDLDPQGAASFTYRVKSGVSGGGENIVKDNHAVLLSIKGTDFDGLDVLPADFSYRNFDIVLDQGQKRVSQLDLMLRRLENEYDTIILDCAPGISLVSENIFAAADALLVPTIPTVLSLRTLGRLLRHLEQSKHRPAHVLPYFGLVDRRKGLHKKVCDRALTKGRGFLECSIPYASLVEQMGVRRKPLMDFSPRSSAAKAYAALWKEICTRLDQVDGAAEIPSRRRVRTMINDLLPEEATRDSASAVADSDISGLDIAPESLDPPPTPPKTSAPPQTKPTIARELEFKMRVTDMNDFTALARVLPELGDVVKIKPANQVNHFFDTNDWALQRHGCVVRLREEDGSYTITAKGPPRQTIDRTLSNRVEEEVAVDAARARQILTGKLSPLDALKMRHSGQHATLTSELIRTLGHRELLHVGSFQNERRRVGPVVVPTESGPPLHVLFEMDRTQFPDGRIDHEVEIEIHHEDPSRCRDALKALFTEAGIPWRSAPSKSARFFGSLARTTV